MDHEVQARLKWVQMYQQSGDAGLTCRRCGISRPTLRKWVRRYESHGLAGLESQSRRPKETPGQKVFTQEVEWILELRNNRRLGVRRIQHELFRLHQLHLSLATIHKVLHEHVAKPLHRRYRRKQANRYTRPVPGERVQADTIKIAPGIYQYTAIDDCTRWLNTALYPRRSAANSWEFLEDTVHVMPFPVQRIQTDRGTEFTAYDVQTMLFYLRIKWRPIPPRSPHLNGKVERVQRTVLEEFYATVDLENLDLEELERQLIDWECHYNYQRIHGAFGKSPMDRLKELDYRVPKWEVADEWFDPVAEYKHLARLGIFIDLSD